MFPWDEPDGGDRVGLVNSCDDGLRAEMGGEVCGVEVLAKGFAGAMENDFGCGF